MDPVVVAKIVSILVVLVVSLVLGNLPYAIIRRTNRNGLGRRGDMMLSMFNAFSGGVFLGACLLHLMDEGREELAEAFKKYKEDIEYPLFEVIVAAGFFAIVFVDFLAQVCLHRSTSIILEDGRKKSTSNGEVNGAYVDPRARLPVSTVSTVSYGALSRNQEKVPGSQDITQPDQSQTFLGEANPHYHSENRVAPVTPTHNPDSDVTIVNHNTPNSHEHTHDLNQLAKTSTVRAVLLLIALSFHTIFDGLAIGLQDADKDVWQVLAAISIHKAIVAFCLGLQLFQAYAQRVRIAVILVVLFSLMSPIGLILGIIVTSTNINEAAQTMASAVLQGLASGTFLYVTFFEILKDAFSHGRGIWNILMAAVGFAAMACVKLMDSHDH